MIVTDKLFDTGGCIAALGTFDGVHHGHRAVIKRALSCGIPVAVVTSKQNPRQILTGGSGRILSPALCDRIFEELGVAAVIRLDFDEIRDLQPNEYLDMLCNKLGAVGFVSGFNFRFGKSAAGNVDTLTEYANERGLVCHICDSVDIDGETVSSSRIRAALGQGNMALTERLMGSRYLIDFEVCHGDARGREMGFPTLNQRYPTDYALPRFGVYASTVTVNGKVYAAVTNVGVRPTFGSDCVLAETHICDFSGDLYGEKAEVTLVRFMREEAKFSSAEALIKQIDADCRKSMEIIKAI